QGHTCGRHPTGVDKALFTQEQKVRNQAENPPEKPSKEQGKQQAQREEYKDRENGSTLPSAKKLRTNGCVMDDHSLPVVPHNTNECWIHEDCGIWSTGVFLVKGKLYGLEEAVRFAQETVCSTCLAAGATMGCFQKGCPNKYHYSCAAQSGCVLNEENFSMRCPKHKVDVTIVIPAVPG
uniref:Transcription factor 20-like n=1 Tax=Salmo trutta TaxID=8032 RepID=A0A673W8I9_SALTR